MSNKKLISFRLPEDLIESLRDQADHDGISLTELVCRRLRQEPQEPGKLSSSTSDLDKLVSTLAQQVQDLKHERSTYPSPSPTPLYALLAPPAPAPTSSFEELGRYLVNKLEKLETRLAQMEKIADDTAPSAQSATNAGSER
ncbi:MAG: hypothetical protein KME20_18115 [Kaiparowitsia implicata GSE-PSE-MK54-09C]|jgi:hypothetical protein|nr:hypothetical protein [Kaiparowitsia implicata GSE-PSE-MK54-09C]